MLAKLLRFSKMELLIKNSVYDENLSLGGGGGSYGLPVGWNMVEYHTDIHIHWDFTWISVSPKCRSRPHYNTFIFISNPIFDLSL